MTRGGDWERGGATHTTHDPERLLTSLVRQAPIGFALLSPEGRYLHVNRELATLHGRVAEDHLGRSLEEIVPEVAPLARQALAQVLAEGAVLRGVVMGGREYAGGLVWEDVWYPLYGDDDQVAAVAVAVFEVSNLRRSHDRRSLLAHFEDVLSRAETVAEVVGALDTVLDERDEVSHQLWLLGGGRLRPVMWRGTELERVANVRAGSLAFVFDGIGPDSDLPTYDLMVAGVPRFFESRHYLLQRYPRVGPVLAAGDVNALAYVPLRGEDGPFGMLRWSWLRERVFPAEERQFYEAVGDRFAAAYERVLRREQEAGVRRRAEKILEALAPLAGAATTADVARVVTSLGPAPLGANALSIAIVDPADPGRRIVIGSVGYPEEFMDRIRVAPLDFPTPPNRAMATAQSVYVHSADELQREYPEVAGSLLPQTQALAALPLRNGGRTVGAISLGFPESQRFSGTQRVEFAGYASHIADALARALRHEEDHEVAVHVQRTLLPARLPRLPGARLAARYLPGSDMEIGGDWYDAVTLDDGRLFVAVGDVMGHGIEAAVAMGQLRAATRALARGRGPADLLSEMDRFVDDVDGASMATLAVMVLDPENGSVQYSLAGHPPPIVRRPGLGVARLGDALGVPLGFSHAAREQASTTLAPGSVVVLYTDGLVERRGEDLGNGLRRLERAVGDIDAGNVEASADRLVAASLEGFRQRDDIALVCLALG